MYNSINTAVYEDPEIVEGYIQRNALKPKQIKNIKQFSKLISGEKVLDLGCGPGHDAYLFAELGFSVTGLDFSNEMISRAKNLKSAQSKIKFLQGDMRYLTQYFPKDQFDAIWASASLLHIEKSELPLVLMGMGSILKNNGHIMISLKGGSGKKIVSDDKYGKPMKREFIFWSKDEFVDFVKEFGLELEEYKSTQSSAVWHYFVFRLSK